MHDQLADQFHQATGSGGPLRLAVTGPPGGETRYFDLDFPFAVIGSAKGCDVILEGPEISYRHCYLQIVQGRPFCIDLGSRTGTFWGDDQRIADWLLPPQAVRIGPYSIQLADETPLAAADFNPLDRYENELGPLPDVELEFVKQGASETRYNLIRMLTLVGRRSRCKLQLDSKTVSGVHCCLLNTPSGPWLIDLLGRNGTSVDKKRVRCAPLSDGQELKIAEFRARIHVSAITEAPTVSLPVAGDPPKEVESAEPAPVPAAAEQPAAAEPVKSIDPNEVEWAGSLFGIDRHEDTLIILPLIDGGWFRYAKLHTESNALRHRLRSPELKNLVFDLGQLNYFGSELIGVLVSLARDVTNAGGKAALCNASEKMQEVLRHMSLHKLWPYYATRDEALKAIHS